MDELKPVLKTIILAQLFTLFLLILQPILHQWLYTLGGKIFFGAVLAAAVGLGLALRRAMVNL